MDEREYQRMKRAFIAAHGVTKCSGTGIEAMPAMGHCTASQLASIPYEDLVASARGVLGATRNPYVRDVYPDSYEPNDPNEE